MMHILGYLSICPHPTVKNWEKASERVRGLPKIKNLVSSGPANVSLAGRPPFEAVRLSQVRVSFHPEKTLPTACPLTFHCLLQLHILVDLTPVLRGINCKKISVQLFSWIHTKGLR